MKVGAFELNEPFPELREPHGLAMLRPWVDAGNVGSLVLSRLETYFGGKELGKLTRPGNFFDFTRYRPVIELRRGKRQVDVPNTYVTYGKQRTGNDFLFLHLLEPHVHGEAYVESVLRLLVKFGVKRYCLLGSMYDIVPHTRPLPVTGGGIGEGVQQELEKLGVESSNYQGPTTIAYLISQRAPSIGIETMTLIVHLPQYAEVDEDYMGAVRLMEMLGSIYEFPMDENYTTKAKQQLEQISTELAKNPELKVIVEQLETHYDAGTRERKEEEKPQLSPEIERFLMEMDERFRED